MLEIFRRNVTVNSILLLPYIFILRISTFIYPQTYVGTEDTWLVSNLLTYIPNITIQSILAIMLIFFQAVTLNNIVAKHRLSKENTLFAGLIYVLLINLLSENLVLSPVLIANTFFILGLGNIFEGFKSQDVRHNIFNSGVFFGLASIIYPPYTVLFLLGFIGLIILRSFKIQEKLQYLSGFLVNYFLLFAILYSPGQAFNFANLFPDFSVVKFNFYAWNIGLITSIIIVVYLLNIIYVLINYGHYMAKKNVYTQKKIGITFWALLFGFIALFFFTSQSLFPIITICLPLAIFLGMNLSDSKTKLLPELIHLTLIGLLVISHFNIF